ncbi:MAG: response regulator transcription factor [Cyclobacteriaceae bacterium]
MKSKIKVIVVEDNPITSMDLNEILNCHGFEILGAYASAEEAASDLLSITPDVLLVDIKLKGDMSGIDLAEQFASQVPIVFLTSNSDKDTVREALKTLPASFLTKPFDQKEVLIALELAYNKFVEKKNANPAMEFPFVFLKSGQVFDKVAHEDITLVKADGSYSKVCTHEKEYLVSANLNQITQKLNSDTFMRVHRSYLINIHKVDSLDQDYVFIGGEPIPVGRTFKTNMKTVLKRFS